MHSFAQLCFQRCGIDQRMLIIQLKKAEHIHLHTIKYEMFI